MKAAAWPSVVAQTKSRILFLGKRPILPHMVDSKYIPACFRQASLAKHGAQSESTRLKKV